MSTVYETTLEQAEHFVGKWFKSTHPSSFRSGEWSRILGVTSMNGRLCWEHAWDDEVCDVTVIDDSDAKPYYVFADRKDLTW